MIGAISRAMKAGLAKVGEPSLLRGVPAGKVSIQHGVQIVIGNRSTEDDNFVGVFTVASIDSIYAPATGDLLEHPDGNFYLDRLHHDNGAVQQFILVRA